MDQPAPTFACNLSAISSTDRPRYNQLVKLFRAAVRERTEVPQGYIFKLDHEVITLLEIADWIGMESLCCPFLTFRLTVSGNQVGWLLELSGPHGVKALLEAEFPAGLN